ncbi:hypothetical protein V6N12_069684 [Hibiscus sabdariffa]|uniref:Uncharacterized protein n=1 Tax=Hibiscus sabdariffa TaxID=183260 RepID=A0ABR2FEJ3_9ROSI
MVPWFEVSDEMVWLVCRMEGPGLESFDVMMCEESRGQDVAIRVAVSEFMSLARVVDVQTVAMPGVEVLLSKGVSCKVCLVNELVLSTISEAHRHDIEQVRGNGRRGKVRTVARQGHSIANESLTNSDFQSRQRAILFEPEAMVQLGAQEAP